MLYEIIIIVLAVLIPFFFLFGFSWGVRFQKNPEKTAEKVKIKKPKRRENAEERKARIEADNIDNYYGPMSAQRDIK